MVGSYQPQQRPAGGSLATDSPGQIKKHPFNKGGNIAEEEIDKTKIVRNITRLLDKASNKHLMLIYQLVYELVKKV